MNRVIKGENIMKTFKELKKGNKLIIKDYIAKIMGYDEQYGYRLEARKKGSNSTYLAFLTTDEKYNEMDEITKNFYVPFSKVEEVVVYE